MEGTLIVAIIALALSGLSLVVAGVALVHSQRADWRGEAQERREVERFDREGRADVRADAIQVYDNPNVPVSGRQLTVTMRNAGAVTAYKPAVWIADEGGAPLTQKYGGLGTLEQGDPARLGAAQPPLPDDGALSVWIGWEDTLGTHEQDTGFRITRDRPDGFRV